MTVLTQPILVKTLSYNPPILPVRLLVDNQVIADFFIGKYIDATRKVFTFGGVVTAAGSYVPNIQYRGKSLALRVGAAYKAHRNKEWDRPELGIYDYRTCAFYPNPPAPPADLYMMGGNIKVTEDEPKPVHSIIQIAEGIVGANSEVILKELNYRFNDDGSKITTITIYSKK